VNSTGLTGALSAQKLANAPAAGIYLAMVYGTVEVIGVGTSVVTLRWTDTGGAQTATTTITITALTGLASICMPIEVASGNVTVEATAPTSGTYRVRARIVALPA
jgi:hypothetical protein